jgi:hypothetical protein
VVDKAINGNNNGNEKVRQRLIQMHPASNPKIRSHASQFKQSGIERKCQQQKMQTTGIPNLIAGWEFGQGASDES